MWDITRRDLRHRKVKWLIQGHTTYKSQRWPSKFQNSCFKPSNDNDMKRAPGKKVFFSSSLTTAVSEMDVHLPEIWPAFHRGFRLELLAFLAPRSTGGIPRCSSHFQHLHMTCMDNTTVILWYLMYLNFQCSKTIKYKTLVYFIKEINYYLKFSFQSIKQKIDLHVYLYSGKIVNHVEVID